MILFLGQKQNRISTLISTNKTVPTSSLLFYASKVFTCRFDDYDCQNRLQNIQLVGMLSSGCSELHTKSYFELHQAFWLAVFDL